MSCLQYLASVIPIEDDMNVLMAKFAAIDHANDYAGFKNLIDEPSVFASATVNRMLSPFYFYCDLCMESRSCSWFSKVL